MDTKDKKEIVNMTDLMNAIVAQACDDYRDAIRGNCKHPDEMLRDVMKFFKSNWYERLTKLDYQYLIDRLDAEWEDGKKLIEVGSEVECPKLRKHYKFDCPLCGGKAETGVTRHKSQKRNDGSRCVNYYKWFICSCHRPERILLKQEVVHENTMEIKRG